MSANNTMLLMCISYNVCNNASGKTLFFCVASNLNDPFLCEIESLLPSRLLTPS